MKNKDKVKRLFTDAELDELESQRLAKLLKPLLDLMTEDDLEE